MPDRIDIKFYATFIIIFHHTRDNFYFKLIILHFGLALNAKRKDNDDIDDQKSSCIFTI